MTNLLSIERVAQNIEAINPMTLNGLNLCFVFGNVANAKDMQVLSFSVPENSLTDADARAQVCNEVLKNIAVALAMDTDPILGGRVDGLKVYSGLKRNIPNRTCRLFLKSQNEILTTYMGGKQIPTAMLKNPQALLQILGYCFIIGQPVEAIRLPNEHKTATKTLVAPEVLARRKELDEQRKGIVEYLKKQQENQLNEYFDQFRPKLVTVPQLDVEIKDRLTQIKEAKKALRSARAK